MMVLMLATVSVLVLLSDWTADAYHRSLLSCGPDRRAGRCRRSAAESDDVMKESEGVKVRTRSDNVELFAVENRRAPAVVVSKPIQKMVEKVVVPSYSGTNNTNVVLSGGSSMLRNSLIGLQAELLRIEAEKEQSLIDDERILSEKTLLVSIDECLLSLLEARASVEDVVSMRRELLSKQFFFRLVELANAENDPEQRRSLMRLYDKLMEAIEAVDRALFVDITADIQKEIKQENSKWQAVNAQRIKANNEASSKDTTEVYNEVLKQWIAQIGSSRDRNASTMSDYSSSNSSYLNDGESSFREALDGAMPNGSLGSNLADAFPARSFIRFPPAMPLLMMPYVLKAPEVSPTDLDVIRNAVFSLDIINQTVVDESNYLTTIRGVPAVSVQDTFQKAVERLRELPAINSRVRLFVLPEYRIPPKSLNVQAEKYSGSSFEPIFLIVSEQAKPRSSGGFENAGAAIALVASIVTSFIYATDVNSFNANFVQQAIAGDESILNRVFLITSGVLGLQVMHDLGHYVMAALYKVKLSFPPIYLPSLQIGLFGSITRFADYPRDRKELFDVSIAGPVSGFLSSLACTLIGLQLTASASPAEAATFPELPSGFFKISFFINELVDRFLHIATIAGDTNALVPIHPLLAVGLGGLLINAFNFMPIGRLDGGRVAMSIAGRKSANGISFATLIAQGVGLLNASSPLALYWILAVVFLQRGADVPPMDDISPISTDEEDRTKGVVWWSRALALAFCVVLTAGILLPMPMDLSSNSLLPSVPDNSIIFSNPPTGTTPNNFI